jgi:hypothetical protein
VQMVEALLLFCKVSLLNCNILCIRWPQGVEC